MRTIEHSLPGTGSAEPGGTNARRLERFIERGFTSPIITIVVAFSIYFALAVVQVPSRLAQSYHPYFVYLAEAFLHGQLGLLSAPPDTNDLVFFQGQIYLYWPPFPAVLFMPLVALNGVQVSDAYLTILVGAINVGLVSIILRELEVRKIVSISTAKRAWLTLFFAFGTVHTTLAPYASVWTTAEVFAFSLAASATVIALRYRGTPAALATGTLAGAAFLTRNPSLFALLWTFAYVREHGGARPREHTVRLTILMAIPIITSIGLAAWYNYARFGNPVDVGLSYHRMSEIFREDFEKFGAFSLHYLPTNLYYYTLAFPYTALLGRDPITYFLMGGSLFLMSPVFCLSIIGIARTWRGHGWKLGVSCIAGITPALVLMGTGWHQYGPRYTLDITVPLLIAAAIGAESASSDLVRRLSLLSMAIYLPGAYFYGLLVLL